MQNNISKLVRTTVIFRTVAAGISSILLMQLISLNSSLRAETAARIGAEVLANAASTTKATLQYQPPLRKAPRRTEGTGSRSGYGYVPPSRSAPRSTIGAGSRGGNSYTPQPRQAPKSTIGAGSRGGNSYTPQPRQAPRSTIGAGSRGGNEEIPLTVTLLIPTDHIGRTTSAHPKFFWYLSEASDIPLEFALIEPGKTQPLFVQQIANAKGGIMQIEMPKDLPELALTKKYRWSVSLVRNAKRRSNDIFVQGWVERMATMPELVKQLTTATTTSQRAEVYAKAGVWYNALEEIVQAQMQAPNDPANIQDLLSLLEQGGQKQVAKLEKQRLVISK